MSRPKDLLSSHHCVMSQQAVSCCDIRGKFASWATFSFTLNLMTARNCSLNLSQDERK